MWVIHVDLLACNDIMWLLIINLIYNSMKKTLILGMFLALVLIVPSVSFAQVPASVYVKLDAQAKEIAELRQRIALLEARLDEQFSKVNCKSSIEAQADVGESKVVANNQTVTFKVHTESNCNMDNKNITLKMTKNGEVFGTSVVIPITGSIKSGSTWKVDTLYPKSFARTDNGDYKLTFIFDGKQTIVPLKIIKGYPATSSSNH